MATLLDNIELLKQHDHKSLAEICHVELDDVQDMINEIWALAHNPGELYDDVIVEPAIPDVSMRRGSEGKWIVELNSDNLPKGSGESSLFFGSQPECSNKRRKTICHR